MIKKVLNNDWFRASGILMAWFMFFRTIGDNMISFLQAHPWILYATVCTILSYLLLFRHRLFLSSRTKYLISKGIQYNTESMLSNADEYLRTKANMTCVSCGGKNVGLKGINKFDIHITKKAPRSGAGLISAVIGCDDCGFIQQHNLPLSIFGDDEDKK
ncbi:MAG: hypothetical protein AB1711_11160 [Thermodesulfobacteriota bacterium]